jgi:hypothetical protein
LNEKKLWWRLGAIFLLVPALLASSGCKQSAKQAKAPEKAELMKTPIKMKNLQQVPMLKS